MFHSSDLFNFRTQQEKAMQDVCQILVSSKGTANEFNEQDLVYTPSLETPCGLDMRPGSERQSSLMTKVEYDATLRLSLWTSIKETDRVRIIRRFGEALDPPLDYEVAGPIQRGPSGIRIRLNKLVV